MQDYRPYKNNGSYAFTESRLLSFPFLVQRDYYVVLRNKTATTKTNIELGLAALKEFATSSSSSSELQTELPLSQNYSFITIKTGAGSTSDYLLTISDATPAITAFDIVIYDANFNVSKGTYLGQGVVRLTLNANTVYYIGISNGAVAMIRQ